MGAQPAWMTLSLSLPRSDESGWSAFPRVCSGLLSGYNVALIGGDTVKGPMVITVQIAGWVETDRWLTRSGARPGDLLFVSGVPGEAAAGLAPIQRALAGEQAAQHLRQRFLRPRAESRTGSRVATDCYRGHGCF